MTLKIAMTLFAIIAFVLGYAALKAPEYQVSRQATINAPAEKVFPYLEHSKLAEKWSPWREVDPTAKVAYSGPDEGVGSRTSWTSSGQLGTGSATIVETVPNQRVGVKLEFTKPMVFEQ